MTKKQRAASRSASLKGQTVSPARQPRAKRDEGDGRGKNLSRGAGSPAPHGDWKRRRRDSVKSSGAPMNRDRNT